MSIRSIQPERPAQGADLTDRALFAMAVHVLKEHHDLGRMWPLSYTMPNGRSIEAVCDRATHLSDTIPGELLRVLQGLAVALSIAEPAKPLRRLCVGLARGRRAIGIAF